MNKLRPGFLIAALGCVLAAAHVCASNTQTEVSTGGVGGVGVGYVDLGSLPSTTENLFVVAENARVRIHRATDSEIRIFSTCPRDWNITGSTVRQVGFSKPRGGVAMMSDQLGARAIVNGRVYALPSGSIGGMQLGKDGVIIGGKKLEPMPGIDKPGDAEGQDTLTIVVPKTYKGSLTIGAADKSTIELDSWTGDNFVCNLMGAAQLKADNVVVANKAILDTRNGPIQVAALTAKVLVANVIGSGSIDVQGGKAEMSNATIKGDGKITLKGQYKNLQKQVDGTGSISVN